MRVPSKPLESPPPSRLDLRSLSPQQLKTSLRQTPIHINDPIRDALWVDLALNNSHNSQLDFDSSLATPKLPLFVEPRLTRFYSLPPNCRLEVSQVLWNIQLSCPHVTYAPLLYPLASLFLHFHSPREVFQSLYSLINCQTKRFLSITRADKSRDAIVLIKLTNKFGIIPKRKFASDARNKLRSDALDAAFAEYIEWITCLPFNHAVRVVDCFLAEGDKFLFRIALCLALLFESHRHSAVTQPEMRVFCESIGSLVTPSQLILQAVKITRLSRKDIQRARQKAESRVDSLLMPEIVAHSSEDRLLEVVLGTRIAPRRFRSAAVDDWSLLDALWEWLPARAAVGEPVVVYCSEEHGLSLHTFYSLCSDHAPTLLLIRSVRNEVFGAFCSSPWSQRLELSGTRAGAYFGTGETFLFRLLPSLAKWEWVGKHLKSVTHSQQLFQSATSKSLSVGSGGATFGLFLDESLTRGQSHSCDTFNNESLSESTNFEVALIEVIAFC